MKMLARAVFRAFSRPCDCQWKPVLSSILVEFFSQLVENPRRNLT